MHAKREEQPLLPDTNWSRAFKFMNTQSDPVINGMLSQVYCQFINDGFDGVDRPKDFDLLYCIQLLTRAYEHKEALANAVKGQFD